MTQLVALSQYFTQPDTPTAGSHIAEIMRKIISKMPATSFEDARRMANALQQESAGKRIYVTPRVKTPEEIAAERLSMRARFAKSAAMPSDTFVSV
jgi:hypothetical protein